MPLTWPDWLDNTWAKSPAKNEVSGESLARHTWNTLERLRDMVSLRPDLPVITAVPRLWHCLFWSCWLHDFGKAADGFQAVIQNEQSSRWGHRHEVLSIAFLDWIKEGLSDEEEDWVTAAILFHHRDPAEIDRRYPKPFQGDSWEDPLADLSCVSDEALRGLWRWIRVCAEPWIQALGFSEFQVSPLGLVPLEQAVAAFSDTFAGRLRGRLDRSRRWIRRRSLPQPLKEALASIIVRGQVISCDHLASAHAGRLLHPTGDPSDLLDRWNMTRLDLFPHQAACWGCQGSAVMVAPTGSGKTEAALLWASSQSRNGHAVPRILYTLPYQASMNAMYDRLRQSSYPDQVGLEHGRSMLALYRRFLDEDLPRDRALMAANVSRNLARLHHQPVRVMSPYQILKGFYRLRGYESLLSDLVGTAFIFDEIHAYDPSRLAMILSSIKYLREQLDARFMVMSATLPSLVRARLFEILGDCTVIQASEETFAQFQRHQVFLADGDVTDDSWTSRIAEEGSSGSSVLVCCNTIRRAQAMYEELKHRLQSTDTEVILLHGRFNGRDRMAKEDAVQKLAGASSKSRAPVILVATQVVEVSLDVDFHVLYTDPAPLEALVQRFGRVNRRRRHPSAPVWVFTEPRDGQGVYDAENVGAALEVLKRVDGGVIREDAIAGWLDEIYSGDLADSWSDSYRRSEREFQAVCIQNLRGFNSDEALEELFYRAFDSVDVLPLCFEEEYRALIEKGHLLEASGLCVSVPWRTAHRFGSQSVPEEQAVKGWPRLINAQYSSEVGLVVGTTR